MNINISIANSQWKKKIINKKDTKKIIKIIYNLTKNNNLKKEINILYSSNDVIQKYNLEYRNKDRATNVLSFVAMGNDFVLGDVIFAYEYIIQEAIEQGKNFDQHLTHLLVHSILHLIGFDHI